MDAMPITNKTLGEPESTKNKTLETGAAATQVCHVAQHPAEEFQVFHSHH
jgi:hypothetical protein